MTTYSTKAAAKKGAKRQNLDLDTLNFLENAEGRWYWEESKAEEVVETAEVETPVIGEFTHCPHCEIHLSNGYQTHDNLTADGFEGNKEFEYVCLACGGEFGPKLVFKEPGVGIKIEKDRPEQNGIVRPSVGGKCRAIWDFCDSFYAGQGRLPMPKEMKQAAQDNGWNENNAVIEMYQWRKFNGYTGRQK